MKTQSITLPTATTIGRPRPKISVDSIVVTRSLARWLVGMASAAAIVVISTLAATDAALDQFLAVILWVAGFGFFGLAIETPLRRIMPVIFSGMGLPVLAVLGTEAAAEFLILGGAVIAAWLAYWVIKRG